MNSILLLSILLVVLGGGTFSSATMSNSFKSFEKKSIGRDRRDLTDFQTQLLQAVILDIYDTSVCPTVPCVSTLDQSWCPSFCSVDTVLFAQIITSIINCYMNGLCERSFTSITLSNVNISIASGSYDGNCFLQGDQVTGTLTIPLNRVSSIAEGPAYNMKIALQYVFKGLTLRCQPVLPCPTCSTQPTIISQNCSPTGTRPTGASQSVGLPCCGNSLLNQLICLVQQLVGSLGVNLYILSCNCNCGGASRWGKRQAADSTAFDIPVTVTQYGELYSLIIYNKNSFFPQMESDFIDTDVSFESPIPSQYATDITNGIKMVFMDYGTGYKLQYYFSDILISILDKYKVACPSC